MPHPGDTATKPITSVPRLTRRASVAELSHRAGPVLAGTVLPFALVLYLALKGGGYDVIVRSEVGIAAWWIVLVGALAGVLPVARIGAAGWTALSLLGAFAIWTAFGIGWSESAEQSVAELGRIATYLGIFALVLAVQGRGALRRTVTAVATAIAVVGILAVLSRLQSSWFPANEIPEFLNYGARERLSYPVNYWNGLAALIAIGVPLLLWVATSARTVLGRAFASAAIPAVVLAAFMTISRGGVIEVAIALAVLLALHPRRLTLLPTIFLSAVGSAILIAAALQRQVLLDNLGISIAERQGDEMLAMMLIVCAGTGLLGAALALAERHRVIRWPTVPGRIALRALAATVVVAGVAAVATGLPGEVSESWSQFKDPGEPATTVERFGSVEGTNRYQIWESAIDANATAVMTGLGPGTFEYWWAREGTLDIFVRDAHSLYFETLAELGVVGLLLVLALVGGVLGVGTARTLRAGPDRAALLAAATAAVAAFAFAAAVDWVWELTVVTVVFFLLAAAIVGSDGRGGPRTPAKPMPGRAKILAMVALAVVAIGSLAAIAMPMAGTALIRESWAEADRGAVDEALVKARTAESIQPYAAAPKLQEAMLLELRGDYEAGAEAAREATRAEPTNWETWLVSSRLEAELGRTEEAESAYRQARSLNPRSPLLSDEFPTNE